MEEAEYRKLFPLLGAEAAKNANEVLKKYYDSAKPPTPEQQEKNRLLKELREKQYSELKEYEIWMEGYSATGEHGTAQMVAKIKARNFREACHIHFFTDFLNRTEKEMRENPQLSNKDELYYDPKELMFWCMRLFDNEADARKAYG